MNKCKNTAWLCRCEGEVELQLLTEREANSSYCIEKVKSVLLNVDKNILDFDLPTKEDLQHHAEYEALKFKLKEAIFCIKHNLLV